MRALSVGDEMDRLEHLVMEERHQVGTEHTSVSISLLRWALIEIRTLQLMVGRYREMAAHRCPCGRDAWSLDVVGRAGQPRVREP